MELKLDNMHKGDVAFIVVVAISCYITQVAVGYAWQAMAAFFIGGLTVFAAQEVKARLGGYDYTERG